MRHRRFVAALVPAVLLLVAPGAGAQELEEEPLAGYVGMASGAAFSFQPLFPGLLPTGDAPFEVTGALTSASIESGGNAYGQAVIAFPGSALANMGPLLGTAAGEPLFTEAIPPFPASVAATQDDGAKSQGAEPGPFIEAVGKPGLSRGRAQLGGGGLEKVFSVDAVVSVSRSLLEGGKLVSESIVTLQGVAIGPALTIDSIRSVARTTSDGNQATSEGRTVVSGAEVGGQPVEITEQGIKASGPLADGVNAALEAAGTEVRLAPSGGDAEGGSADRIGGGVVVTVANPVASANPQFEGSKFRITMAPVAAGALASPPFDSDFSDELALPDVATMGSAGGGFSDFSSAIDGMFGSTPGSLGATGDAVAAGVALDAEEAGSLQDVAGMTVGLALTGLFAVWLGSRWLRRYVGRLSGVV